MVGFMRGTNGASAPNARISRDLMARSGGWSVRLVHKEVVSMETAGLHARTPVATSWTQVVRTHAALGPSASSLVLHSESTRYCRWCGNFSPNQRCWRSHSAYWTSPSRVLRGAPRYLPKG